MLLLTLVWKIAFGKVSATRKHCHLFVVLFKRPEDKKTEVFWFQKKGSDFNCKPTPTSQAKLEVELSKHRKLDNLETTIQRLRMDNYFAQAYLLWLDSAQCSERVIEREREREYVQLILNAGPARHKCSSPHLPSELSK